ncbi:uncharacterized protein LOC143632151 [Bidens hawaiensis]|uniref:uncharacterized protein LOC143632151 n=1 Tax=Bidens hawaiensis TaxID=980011 RepID=UPI0040499A3E
MEREAENSDRFSKPMVWIGIYVAIASLFCILAMVADLLHGFRSKKFWFPCKYFSLNAASIAVITIAMKLPVDLSSMMPSYMDQETKPGSLGFLCTMMANLMPSLASMDNKTLLANVNTSVITSSPLGVLHSDYVNFNIIASIYAVMTLLLLFIMISSSLTIPNFKEILESKYQATTKICLAEQRLPLMQMSTVEKLRQHVRRYWVMAETGSPQFAIASSPLSVASGLICARWFTPSIASSSDDIDEDLNTYVLKIDIEIEIAERTPKGISNSMNHFILKAEKEQNNNLIELLKKSTGFKGVEIFDSDHVQPLMLHVELVNSWSLPIVTLTCIAVVLPNILKDTIENLFKSVGKGLSYTHLVEESLNRSREYVNLIKVSMALWHEVGNKSEVNESSTGELVENPSNTLIAANSMYRITQTILLRHQSNTELITNKQLFAHLNGMIADVFSACFANIPRVITMRCHESVIDKREASVKVAARLLGKTRKIIERLETLELPNMDEEKMAYTDEWRLYLKQSIP